MTGLKEHVEGKIFKDYMVIKMNLNDFQLIDKYCKDNYNNNRKQMILDLIKYRENDVPVKLLDDKLHLLYNEFNERVTKLELVTYEGEPVTKEAEVKKTNSWQGFK